MCENVAHAGRVPRPKILGYVWKAYSIRPEPVPVSWRRERQQTPLRYLQHSTQDNTPLRKNLKDRFLDSVQTPNRAPMPHIHDTAPKPSFRSCVRAPQEFVSKSVLSFRCPTVPRTYELDSKKIRAGYPRQHVPVTPAPKCNRQTGPEEQPPDPRCRHPQPTGIIRTLVDSFTDPAPTQHPDSSPTRGRQKAHQGT